MKIMFLAFGKDNFSELKEIEEFKSATKTLFLTDYQKLNSRTRKLLSCRYEIINNTIFFIINLFLSIINYFIYRPDVIITNGNWKAIPLVYLAKLFLSKIIFIEPLKFQNKKSVAGIFITPISNLVLVQWPSMKLVYPDSIYRGWMY